MPTQGRTLNSNYDSFKIVKILTGACVRQRNTQWVFVCVCVDKKENGFKLRWIRSRRYSTETITDADYADDLALLANTHAQIKPLLHCLDQLTGVVGFCMNANKTGFLCFKREGAILTISSLPLKLVDHLKYHICNTSFTESDISIRLEMAWTAIEGLSNIW